MTVAFRFNYQIVFLSVYLCLPNVQLLTAGSITQVRAFDTYSGGIILSTDPAGIAYNGVHLFIVDSEINETGLNPPGYFVGQNIFETSLFGNILYNGFITVPPSGVLEPTGICYNPMEAFFYIVNDDTRELYQYELRDQFTLVNYWPLIDMPIDLLEFQINDPEGIAVNPISGNIYIADGENGINGGGKIFAGEIRQSNILFTDTLNVLDRISDPEGIAYHENSGHLFIISGPEDRIFEYDTLGNYIDEFDLFPFQPRPRSPQGLTFAPNSTDNSRISLYITDGGIDESPERARVYEADLGDKISKAVGLFMFRAFPSNDFVRLEWTTINAYENISWLIERRDQDSDEFIEIARLDGLFAAEPNQVHEYYDYDVLPSRTYFYRLLDVDSTGNNTVHQDISVAINPQSFYLAQNYPNPFNPKTRIEFDLPIDTHVKIDVFNTLGQLVYILVDENRSTGHYEIEFNGRNFSSGIYFYRIIAENYQEVKRMVLIK